MKQVSEIDNVENFRIGLPKNMAAVIVELPGIFLRYGELIAKHDVRHIACRKTGAAVKYPGAVIHEITND